MNLDQYMVIQTLSGLDGDVKNEIVKYILLLCEINERPRHRHRLRQCPSCDHWIHDSYSCSESCEDHSSVDDY
jgi:hypothetical protein